MWRDSIHMCTLDQSDVQHDSLRSATCLIHLAHFVTHSFCSFHAIWHYLNVRHDSFIITPWRRHKCDTARALLQHNSFICATRLIHQRDMTHSFRSFRADLRQTIWMGHVAHINALYRTHNCSMSHRRMSRGARANTSRPMCEWVTSHVRLGSVSHGTQIQE